MDQQTKRRYSGGGRRERPKSGLERSHAEIRLEVLQTLLEGEEDAGKLMYKTDLSFAALSEHLRDLSASGLVANSSKGARSVYLLTEKGAMQTRSYLDALKTLGQILFPKGKDVTV